MGTSIDDPDGPCLTVLSPPMQIWLGFATLAGVMSTTMVLLLLGLVAHNFIRNVKNPPPGGKWSLIRTPIDAYLLSLLGSEIVQGVGATLNVKWVLEGVSYCSDYCSAQGALKTIGETGVAMSTLAIAVHTFIVIFFWWIPGKRSVWIHRIVISLIWSYTTLFVIIAFFRYRAYNTFFIPVPYWCWVRGGVAEWLIGEYLWLWMALILPGCLYTLVFFRLRGNIQVDQNNWKRIHFQIHPDPNTQPTTVTREAMAVIWYPICDTLLVGLLTVYRWLPKEYTSVHLAGLAITLFGFSGVDCVASGDRVIYDLPLYCSERFFSICPVRPDWPVFVACLGPDLSHCIGNRRCNTGPASGSLDTEIKPPVTAYDNMV